MSDADSFIEEVTEEVRRDRLFATFRKYGWIAVVAVLLLVGGAGWTEWQKAQQEAAAQAFGDALDDAVAITDPAERAQTVGSIEAPTPTASALTAMMQAADLGDAGKLDEAEAKLRAVAADEAVPQVYRDMATIKALMLPTDTTPQDRIAALEPLSAPGAPFRATALEMIATAHIDAGEPETAVELLRQLMQEPAASDGMRQRAGNLIVALGFPILADDPAASGQSDG